MSDTLKRSAAADAFIKAMRRRGRLTHKDDHASSASHPEHAVVLGRRRSKLNCKPMKGDESQ